MRGFDDNTVKISVIVPVYNVEKYLRECLDSVVNQTLRDIEIICVEGGSADGSMTVLREYADTDDRFVVIDQKSKGLSGARNEGLDVATGKYIYFLDSDDMLRDLNALSELYDFAEREHTDILFFDGDVKYDSEKAYTDRRHVSENYYTRAHNYSKITSGPELFAAMMKNDEYRCMSCMYLTRAEHIGKHKLRFYEGILHEDDLYTYLCLMQAGRAAHIGKPYYLRRVRAGSLLTAEHGFHEFYSYLIDYIGIQEFSKQNRLSGDILQQTDRFLGGVQDALISMYNTVRGTDDWLGKLDRKEQRVAAGLLEVDMSGALTDTVRARFTAKYLPVLLPAVVILFVIIYAVCWVGQKKEYHQDEMFSMMNIRGGELDRPYYYDSFFNTWYTGAELESMIGVSRGNEFSAVFSSDSLYWSLLHIAYSFTPDNFTIWPSVMLNILALAGSLVVIYLLSLMFIDNKYLALLPVLIWGVSSAAVNLVLFIRFYCFKTFICLLLLYVVLTAVKNGFNKWIYPAVIALLMCIGVFIHQYFLVYAFFLTAVVCVYLLITKRFKPFFIYTGLMAAGALVYEFITGAITHVLTSGGDAVTVGNRAEEAIFSLLRGNEGYAGRIQNYLIVLSNAVFARISPVVMLIVFAFLVVIYILHNRREALAEKQPVHFWLLICCICVCYFLMIARIAPYQEFRYISCITPLVVVLFVSLLVSVLKAAGIKSTVPVFAIIALPCSFLLFMNISSIIPNVELGRYNDVIDDYRHLPVICISNENWEVSRCYWQLFDFEDEILVTTTDDVDFDVIGQKEYSNGALLMLLDIYNSFDPEDAAGAAGLESSTYVTTLMRHHVYLLE